jgi:hypothetical protein
MTPNNVDCSASTCNGSCPHWLVPPLQLNCSPHIMSAWMHRKHCLLQYPELSHSYLLPQKHVYQATTMQQTIKTCDNIVIRQWVDTGFRMINEFTGYLLLLTTENYNTCVILDVHAHAEAYMASGDLWLITLQLPVSSNMSEWHSWTSGLMTVGMPMSSVPWTRHYIGVHRSWPRFCTWACI